ncbi:MAG: ribonuclease HII [Rhodospirillales bacterium]|jgi:ribonuclease HII|nr:ribonuclease HII [Rhodospirillales bacterium]
MPDFSIEHEMGRTLARAGGGRIAGVDEVGRGPLAGPVVAAAVVFPRDVYPQGIPPALAALIDDSKALSAARREAAFAALTGCRRPGGVVGAGGGGGAGFGVEIGVGAASVAEIARLNILGAALLAMSRAVARLPHPPDLALIDGNRAPALACPARCVVGGDALSLSIAAASIVAKVLRDRLMLRLAGRWPGYGWDANAGYATASHRAALRRLGPSPHHRTGFGTVRKILAETAPARCAS